MSSASEPLRDEVWRICCIQLSDSTNVEQGTRTQVIIAGAVAGLVSRSVTPPYEIAFELIEIA